MKITDNEIRLLTEVCEHFAEEDRTVRERQIRTWRRLKFFWEGFQKVWYSETAHDWRVYDSQENDSSDQSYYDKPVNIFRAYLESIIAALSVTVPPIQCIPDDADNPLDLMTARGGNKIAQLVFRHNNVTLLWIHALFIFCTEGMVAAWNYPKTDSKYGEYEEKKYQEDNELHETVTCPNCGNEFEDRLITEGDEFQSSDSSMMESCPECGMEVNPEVREKTLTVTRIVGITKKAKTRQILEAYGGLYVKVANYAKKQGDTPYLIFSEEKHYAIARSEYPDIRNQIQPGTGGTEEYERWGRLSPQYQGEYPINNVTCRKFWLRASAFETLEEDEARALKKKFPVGARVDFVNDTFASAENQSLDDCWTLTYNPLSDYLQHDPLGLLLTSLQEITNDLMSLILQTIEHGIPQTFADPGVLNFDQYRQTEVSPGSIFPATPKSGKAMNDAFYEVKTATLSAEVLPFANQIQSLAQLVSGALPSLFGGQLEGSKTASEYSMSRSQALQRQQTTWKTLIVWWKEIFGKVIPQYIKSVQEQGDEKFVEQDEFGNFINIFIRRAEMEGKIGGIELEANENLPLTFTQTRDLIMQLLQANNPEIQATMAVPENLPLIREAIGLTDFYIAGEDDRNKQYEEIKQLLNSEPIVIPPDPMMMEQAMMSGLEQPQEQEEPSVEIEPEIDNHQIQYDICRKWAVSDAGRLAKIENPNGYKNVLLHAQQHNMILQEQMMQASLAAAQGAGPVAKPTEQDREAPIMGEQDVQVQ